MAFSELVALFLHFLLLSFLAIGGFSTMLPEMHRYVVEANHWMSSEQFAAVYVLAQLSPGPNAMYVTLLGWKIAGWAGAIATTLAMLGPACTITIVVARMHSRDPNSPLAHALRRGLAPVALGLFVAGALVLARSADYDWRGYLLTVVAVVVVLRTRWNPLWVLALGAVAGMSGLLGKL